MNKFINLIFKGGTKETSTKLTQAIITSNAICFFIGVFLLLPLSIFQFIKDPKSSVVAIVTLLITVGAFFLNRGKSNIIGRWISGIILFFIFTMNASTLLPEDLDIPYSFSILLFGLALLPFIVFTSEEKYSLIISLSITFLGIIFFEDISHAIPNSEIKLTRSPVFSRIFIVLGAILGFGTVALLIYQAQKRTNLILNSLNELKGKESEMEKQQEELQKTLSEIDVQKEEEKKRIWANDGMVEFGQIMRNNNGQELYSKLINGLVEYVDAKLGAIYEVVNDGDQNFIEMRACYAYDREKFLEGDKILPGEGLIGQCYLEAKKIYLTNVPQNFPKIKSGLGDITPNCVIIVPLMNEDEVTGILEFAGFKEYEEHEITFLEKLGENIASTINREKVGHRTQLLLLESKEQSEVMQQQEEEMRQNMEEMQATQDMMDQKENEYLDEIKDLKKKIRELEKPSEE